MEEEKEQTDSQEKDPFIKIKRFPFIMGVLLLIIVTAGITVTILTFGTDKAVPLASTETDEHPEFEKLYSTYETLKNEFYEDIDNTELVDGAISGMIEALDDPYSTYMNEEEAKSFHESISASFEGIGAEIQQQDDQIMVVSPIKGSPAEKAGIKPNDIIESVDGESIEGLSATEAVLKIRGEKGTKVELSVVRDGEEKPLTITIVRDTIPVETVYSEMLSDGIAKIQVTSFSERTSTELEEAIAEMNKKGMKGLILDLRGNPGGLLTQAIDIASMFVPNGKIVLQVEYPNGEKQVEYSKNDGELKTPVVVLIDSGSASASEIVAAAVSESADIQLIGGKSFGKGTVQNAKDFEDGSNYKYTAAKWLTPEGNWIHSKGIKPDIEVSLPEYSSLAYISPEKEMKVSESGTEIETAEKMLKAVGFDPGKVDGTYDQDTVAAVSALQKDQGIKVTGILTGDSTTKLMTLLSKKILDNDTQVEKAQEVLKKQIKGK